ncbi:MAG: glutamate--tRNA ligase family protein, partial [Hyphomicrobiales bacterium]|nr:glutamate--tRNA ligase family protein [Hyphomicrobiales bacterium]
AYRAVGYLPNAMRNYLARLGWSHGDDEVFSTEQMIEWFSLDAIGKAPARFDFAKLENLNGIYIRNTADDELADAIDGFLPHSEMDAATVAKFHAGRAQLIGALAGLKARAKTMIELVNGAAFLFAERPLKLDEKAAGILNDGGRQVLGQLIEELDNQADWTTEALEENVKAFAEARDIKLGKIAQPLRAALTGTTVSPGIFDVLVVLGRDESLGRIRDHIS